MAFATPIRDSRLRPGEHVVYSIVGIKSFVDDNPGSPGTKAYAMDARGNVRPLATAPGGAVYPISSSTNRHGVPAATIARLRQRLAAF